MTIPALSLWQPWASLVALGEKRIETRHFDVMKKPGFRPGPVAIHATQKWPSTVADMCMDEHFYPALKRHGFPLPDGPDISLPTGRLLTRDEQATLWCFIPKGKILCVVDAIECLPFEKLGDLHPQEEAFGNYGPGRWGLVFGKILETFEPPIPWKGQQTIGWPWEWDTEISRAITRDDYELRARL